MQPAYHLGPSVSLDCGAPPFVLGECILVRIPDPIQVEGYVENEASFIGTNLPPMSTGSGCQHFAFVRELHLQLDGSLVVEVYPVLSFTNTGGALATYNRMNDATTKAALLPLLPLLSQHPTPDAFGEPLDFGNWSTTRDSFLHVFPRRFTMTTKRLVSFLLMIGSLFLIAVEFSLKEWTLLSSCLAQCSSALLVTKNTCCQPQTLRIMVTNPIPLLISQFLKMLMRMQRMQMLQHKMSS
jgi:hypothetical protein